MTAASWTGRVDGTTPEHLRWHQAVTEYVPGGDTGACAFLGFASDAGIRRNKGRPGAAQGPGALRRALSPMALRTPLRAVDAGTVTVFGDDLEGGQHLLGTKVSGLLDDGAFPVVLGGGHEVAYGTYLGVAGSTRRTTGTRVGILNLDAHFDLRPDPVPSSGTPFRQILDADPDVRYAVLGISQPSNTTVLFDTADRFGVSYLLDDDCEPTRAGDFVAGFLAGIDLLHLTIDLDVLPAAVAPGVSAPAAFGVPLSVVQAVCDQVTGSGKLAVVDVAELNPALDPDQRTARTAARLIHRIVTGHVRG
ncbi:formimidoylglutamase [Nocardia rhizosphaerae]|uniref:Formimidoylglutamase n=1 Tax=Nocardia rhizosphaerae TaxID=1691571 RepID=A0ABV8LEM7_9NOCA